MDGKGTKLSDPLSNNQEGQNCGHPDEDREYVMLCRTGDLDAFGVLVRRHQKKMLNIAFRMTGDYEDACDVVQEAFLSAYRMIKKFRGEAKFSTWLYGIVVNHARNRIRSIRSKARHESVSLDDKPDAKEGAGAMEPPSRECSAVDLLIQKETRAKVQQCINSLEEEHREVLVLRDIQGFSYDEISIMLKIPEGTVKSRLSRARDALRNSLRKVQGGL